MATTVEDIEVDIGRAATPGFRGQLLARGQARAMIWRDGVLPPGAPAFSPFLSYDLHSYGYALLGLGLRLREIGGSMDQARIAFGQAAAALEAVVANGAPEDPSRHFHLVIAAAAYHLGHYSARAYSLLSSIQGDLNFSLTERLLSHLMLRNLRALEREVLSARLAGDGTDGALRARFEQEFAGLHEEEPAIDMDGESFLFDGLDRALSDNFCAGMAIFLMALERGAAVFVERALARLRVGLAVCANLNLLPSWWSHRIAIHLIGDLWSSTFHEKVPLVLAGGDAAAWSLLRRLFIALLHCRQRAEIDLWPSQVTAAVRAADQSDDLVVSLPTSAGKTRIAELCILRCLAAGRRIIFVTPLRALSAQTEASLQRTFGPLGKTISALYGSIGASGFDEDAIRRRDIVVATPEKLDFTLRNDPSLIDNVGLVVFDEGHMIGTGEREVRYEVQIQRLLRRPDAAQRRVVCLSAILPDGEQLEDFANWLRRDRPGGVVKNDWRPTRLRYGEVVRRGNFWRLNIRVEGERPFVPRFLRPTVPPIGGRTTPFPRDQRELCLATAWRLVEDGQSVLVFCPVRASVQPFATRIVDLNHRGALPSLLSADPVVLETALVLGAEWLGADHPILQCLRLGIAIHHGALPTAFRKEVERLLRENVLKVTISSPTLAQGLNLSATAVVFHALHRQGERIQGHEFKNVVGRAGRAFVDVEGLVLSPMFDDEANRLHDWEKLRTEQTAIELESGLVRLVITLLQRLSRHLGGPPAHELVEYVVNNAAAWDFPTLAGESHALRTREEGRWAIYLTSLDTAILSLLGEHDIDEAAIAATLDDVLSSSLWERTLNRRPEQLRDVIKAALAGRAKHVWAHSTAPQRKGYFLAGVGLATGNALDAMAPAANALLLIANTAILNGDSAGAVEAITAFAERAFVVPPFVPDELPNNWREILRLWLTGAAIAPAAADQEARALRFVEGGLIYRLPWAMEAVRVRGLANGDTLGEGCTFDDVELGLAVAAVETGTLSHPAAILIQAGFNSRLAAIKAVHDTNAAFASGAELVDWLGSDEVAEQASGGNWPTPETAAMWQTFIAHFTPPAVSQWSRASFSVPVAWNLPAPPASGTAVRIYSSPDGQHTHILSEDTTVIGTVEPLLAGTPTLNLARKGLTTAVVRDSRDGVDVSYFGPDDLLLE